MTIQIDKNLLKQMIETNIQPVRGMGRHLHRRSHHWHSCRTHPVSLPVGTDRRTQAWTEEDPGPIQGP